MLARLLRDRWFQIGLGLVVLGWGPLFAIIAAAELGLLADPNPNPVGPGLLFFFTSWPAVICLGVGAVRVLRGTPASGDGRALPTNPAARLTAAIIAGFLAYRLGALLFASANGGTSAVALIIGGIAGYWVFAGRLPGRWGRQG